MLRSLKFRGDISSIYCIKNVPLLVQVFLVDNNGDSRTKESLVLKHLSDVTLNHLREAKLERFTGRIYELQLIKIL
ncbi:hypothetical protein HAX54_045403 [Datura stramonium]|uniref:Uncharacterized protein n=1 Tax=Datura stramonium TaxID=4076 RepID=A0ABS8SQJ0_DATST|nr:hypothetical protein [Datura stramonium]